MLCAGVRIEIRPLGSYQRSKNFKIRRYEISCFCWSI